MANRIEIRGVIVPSDMDQDFMFSYIQRGMITPESVVRKAIAKVDPKEDIDLYINSQGGSVFAGNEMINALQDWKVETGNKINVTVGAMAASMGSSIMVSVADTVKVHTNTKIMFHGAFGGAIGGAEAMKDYSDLLEKINADIKVKLLSKYDLDADVVNEWFAEGREGWVTAEEAKSIGMADEIIGEDDSLPESANNIESMLNEKGMKIAALTLDKLTNEETNMNPLKLIARLLGVKEDTSEEEVITLAEQAIELQENTNEEETTEESDTANEADGNDEEASDVEADESDNVEEDEEVQDLNDVAIEMQDKVNGLNDALNKKQSEMDKLKVQVEQLTAKNEKLLGGGLGIDTEEAPADWKSCLSKCDGDYENARKQFPAVYAELMKKANN